MSDSPKPESVTRLLVAWRDGSQQALDRLIPLVYQELRAIAGRYLSHEPASHTLQSTALVHEAYVKLIGQRRVQWQNRAHFFGIAAQMMRRILVDHARRQHRDKRGGWTPKLSLDEAMAGRDELYVTFDGQEGYQLEAGDEVRIRCAERRVRLLRPSSRSYFEVLRQKLKWNER